MGTAATRKGDTCSGHGCFPPRPSTSGSGDVFVNGIPSVRQGDSYAIHSCGDSVHGGSQSQGSGTVFVNGKPMARVGDNVSCGSVASQGSNDVFVGG